MIEEDKIDAFAHEIEEVCRKYNIMFDHEDRHGSFIFVTPCKHQTDFTLQGMDHTDEVDECHLCLRERK